MEDQHLGFKRGGIALMLPRKISGWCGGALTAYAGLSDCTKQSLRAREASARNRTSLDHSRASALALGYRFALLRNPQLPWPVAQSVFYSEADQALRPLIISLGGSRLWGISVPQRRDNGRGLEARLQGQGVPAYLLGTGGGDGEAVAAVSLRLQAPLDVPEARVPLCRIRAQQNFGTMGAGA